MQGYQIKTESVQYNSAIAVTGLFKEHQERNCIKNSIIKGQKIVKAPALFIKSCFN